MSNTARRLPVGLRARGEDSLVQRVDALVRYPGSGVGDLAERSEQHLRKKLLRAWRRRR